MHIRTTVTVPVIGYSEYYKSVCNIQVILFGVSCIEVHSVWSLTLADMLLDQIPNYLYI